MPTIADLEREFYIAELGLDADTTLSNADLKYQWLESEVA